MGRFNPHELYMSPKNSVPAQTKTIKPTTNKIVIPIFSFSFAIREWKTSKSNRLAWLANVFEVCAFVLRQDKDKEATLPVA